MENNEKIVKIGFITAKQLWNLLDYLESLDNDEETKKESALIKLENFLPNIKTNELMVLKAICKERDSTLFNSFVMKYPHIEFDLTGTTKPKNQEPWRVKLLSLEQVFQMSKQTIDSMGTDVLQHKQNQQIIHAKNLKCLKNIKYRDLALTRKLFIQRFHNQELPIRVEDFEILKKELNGLIKNFNKLESLILDNCLKYSNKEDFEFFLSHVFARLDVLACDKNLEEKVNKEFLETINNIISLNN